MTNGAGPETGSLIRWYHPAATGPDRPDLYQTIWISNFLFRDERSETGGVINDEPVISELQELRLSHLSCVSRFELC